MFAIYRQSFPPIFTAACLLTTTAGGASPPRLSAPQLQLPGKKGACFTLREPGSNKQGTWEENLPRVKMLNPSWNYSWGLTRIEAQPESIEFVPMVWGAKNNSDLQKRLEQEVVPQIRAGHVKRLLAMNEPDKQDQANMPYTRALELWPTLEKLGIPLCSPACANAEGINDHSSQGVPGTWMRDFMREVDQRGYRVDYVGVHWYGGGSFENFKTKLKRIYEKYGRRPLLITEFAVADWKAESPATNRHRPDKVLAFMKQALPWMEAQDWIAGYAWFSFGIDSRVGTSSALFDNEGALTACGKYYRSVSSANPGGDQSIRPDRRPDRRQLPR